VIKGRGRRIEWRIAKQMHMPTPEQQYNERIRVNEDVNTEDGQVCIPVQ